MLSRKKIPPSLSYLDPSAEFEGTLRARGQVRIDGRIKGTLLVEGDLEVGPKGMVDGPLVQAKNILIHGTVKAEVVAQEKLVLSKSAQVEGDIRAKSLDIEPGAAFIGRSHTGEIKALPTPGK